MASRSGNGRSNQGKASNMAIIITIALIPIALAIHRLITRPILKLIGVL